MSKDTVKVAVRIRPLIKTEVERGCQSCIDVVPGEPQIQIKNCDKAFRFNYVFPCNVSQEQFYNTAVKEMVSNIFQGYNVTILAYGQTGSGKTHSMGTNYTGTEEMGIIPRAVNNIFNIMESSSDRTFTIAVSFMELYQEQLYDLLSDKQRNESIVDIREDGKGIKMVGITERVVTNSKETLQCLQQGSLGRATGATAMNAQSSRSHAIFTLTVHQQKEGDPNTATTAKFHLVDLAGSERSKKTQATGERFKEGVNINKGLLALGNVISQLGEGGPTSYVGYRDSKLTRLLQDSLGGNSMTLMIACISPADYNLDETLSTLRYADRARKIKNKPVINQDPNVSEINRLNKLVQELRLALVGRDIGVNCPPEHHELEEKNHSLQSKLRDLTEKLNANLIEFVFMHERAELAEHAREKIMTHIADILEDVQRLLEFFNEDTNNVLHCRSKVEAIYQKLVDIQNEQKKTSEELLNHEITVASSTNETETTGNDSDSVLPDEGSCNDSADIEYFDEKQEEYTMQQAERNSEVQNINKQLAIKETLVSQLLKNSVHMSEQSKELQEMEQEIKNLQTEKELLLQALRDAHTSSASSKLAETRRKKVQELEKKISELTRKCTEQSRIIKMKERSDQQLKNLSNEIQSLKQTKVKLIRQMRTESDKFTKWRQTREKELCKLRDQDRKRVNQMARIQLQHSKQQNVQKRKMEEAQAVIKRLKDALERQRKASEKRDKSNNSKEGVRTWVTQELDVLLSTVDAENSLQKLMRDRATLTGQLEELKKNSTSSADEITELTEYINIRNAQIADIQQKIVESDQENRANTRWHLIHTMADAKSALTILFETLVENNKKQCAVRFDYEELQDKYDMLQARVREYEQQEKQKTYVSSTDHKDNETEDITKLKEELEIYKERCNQLEGKVLSDHNSGNNGKKSKSSKKTRTVSEGVVDINTVLTDDSLSEDDIEKDPDWKRTPFYNRIQKLLDTTNVSARNAIKRSSDGDIKCACKTRCATRMCTCRKNDVACKNCNCNADNCQNKDKENLARTLFVDSLDNGKVEALESIKKARQ